MAGTLATVCPDPLPLQVSRETLYIAIYAMSRGELRTLVIDWLRFGQPGAAPAHAVTIGGQHS